MRRIASLVALLLVGCASAGRRGPTGPTPDELAAQLTTVDRAMSQLSARSGMGAAYAAMFDPEAVKIEAGTPPLRGRDAAVAATMRCGTACSLTWEPQAAAANGAMGYTWGTYVFTQTSGDGSAQRSTGTYVTVWKRNEHGDWKAVLDSRAGDAD